MVAALLVVVTPKSGVPKASVPLIHFRNSSRQVQTIQQVHVVPQRIPDLLQRHVPLRLRCDRLNGVQTRVLQERQLI